MFSLGTISIRSLHSCTITINLFAFRSRLLFSSSSSFFIVLVCENNFHICADIQIYLCIFSFILNKIILSIFQMPLTYYYDLMSQPCRAVYIFLKMTGIPYQAKEIALRKMEHMTEEYVQMNPFKKVPVIDDSGFILTERYFEEEKK